MDLCKQVNPRIQVKRAKFSVVQPREINEAWSRPIELDMQQAFAVDARSELDLRIGAAFTRLQTLTLQSKFNLLAEKIVSYGNGVLLLILGPCQFPTLGFVVARYKRVNAFVPEDFWKLSLNVQKDGKTVNFSWSRGVLFDESCTKAFQLLCQEANVAKITSVTSKPTSNW